MLRKPIFILGLFLAFLMLFPSGLTILFNFSPHTFYADYVIYILPFILLYNIFINAKFKYSNAQIIFVAMGYSSILIMASIFSSELFKGSFIAIYFLLATVNLFYLYKSDIEKTIYFNKIIFVLIELWLILPIIFLFIFDDSENYFLNAEESALGGFSGSRIEYGLWSIAAIILLHNLYRIKFINKKVYLITLTLNLAGIYLAQSRGAFIALFLSYILTKFRRDRITIKFFLKVTFIMLLIISIMLSWELYGRQNNLQFINETRYEIYSAYFRLVDLESIVLGQGKHVSIILGDGGLTQAHNLILQWLVNWGILGLISLMLYLWTVLRSLNSQHSRMLFFAFLSYSMMQPVQGTANFFGPVTFLFFMVIIGLENSVSKGVA